MTQPIISVENLSKGYRIGAKEEAADTIVGALTKSIRAPLRNLRRLHEATSIRDGDERDDILWALKDVSFEVHEGEVVGVIGRNGAGKSTLLKILSRITEPTGGRAVIRGRVSSLLEVGTGFHPELTGRENIYMNGTILGMTKREIDRKFDEIIDFSGVEKFLDTPTKRYSSGMQVRLAFAVAAHLEPEILIIDEVLAVGDAEFQKKCLGKMKDVADGGRTVLFVSHNLAAVKSLCTRGLLIQSGKCKFAGDTSEALAAYANISPASSNAGERGDTYASSDIYCSQVEASLIGHQPNMKLILDLKLRSNAQHPPLLIAIDLFDTHGDWLMQTLPSDSPFVHSQPVSEISISIDLPPLIPGDYQIGIWAGTALWDGRYEDRSICSVSVVDPPVHGRSLPHNPMRGHIAPTSRLLTRSGRASLSSPIGA
ncbi:polysaccharide ABC transporter ATP-binding protein [Botrimarina mediterranea]|uniref:Teichoic acids export ATP-binding protein TagH n=1 Tax=Botrimarina mediterranea TaxID=2528022 RepID=A0A518KBF7_9BACT|nr:polysaccharide ABC transporter ATP-binding protein [Botrimarina mediterranea]QDV75122.1 Teichoic acids export ATP-binding protein TagH [Botrimarina mediterranea]QDV79767.1 Teichoic acids export ATP-binding protein TagH [Planctomycetes bacterium K2D]